MVSSLYDFSLRMARIWASIPHFQTNITSISMISQWKDCFYIVKQLQITIPHISIGYIFQLYPNSISTWGLLRPQAELTMDFRTKFARQTISCHLRPIAWDPQGIGLEPQQEVGKTSWFNFHTFYRLYFMIYIYNAWSYIHMQYMFTTRSMYFEYLNISNISCFMYFICLYR